MSLCLRQERPKSSSAVRKRAGRCSGSRTPRWKSSFQLAGLAGRPKGAHAFKRPGLAYKRRTASKSTSEVVTLEGTNRTFFSFRRNKKGVRNGTSHRIQQV